mmetsp:Transcript_31846/g.67854  ORF Transcript_31846/g.67854 Transcript_31846/m.67854 type:complete len:268 (-) Transcript_31846:552-1355(-)
MATHPWWFIKWRVYGGFTAAAQFEGTRPLFERTEPEAKSMVAPMLARGWRLVDGDSSTASSLRHHRPASQSPKLSRGRKRPPISFSRPPTSARMLRDISSDDTPQNTRSRHDATAISAVTGLRSGISVVQLSLFQNEVETMTNGGNRSVPKTTRGGNSCAALQRQSRLSFSKNRPTTMNVGRDLYRPHVAAAVAPAAVPFDCAIRGRRDVESARVPQRQLHSGSYVRLFLKRPTLANARREVNFVPTPRAAAASGAAVTVAFLCLFQ